MPGRSERRLGRQDRPPTGERPASVTVVEIDPVITCIDCGGRAHLISYPPDERDWEPGDLTTYRCEDCLERWDLVVPDDDHTGESP